MACSSLRCHGQLEPAGRVETRDPRSCCPRSQRFPHSQASAPWLRVMGQPGVQKSWDNMYPRNEVLETADSTTSSLSLKLLTCKIDIIGMPLGEDLVK